MPQTTITYNQIKKLAGDTTVVIMASALTFISSKYIMSEAMDNPELGNLFGIGCVSSVTTLAVTWDPGEKIVKFLRDKAKQTQYSNVINLSLPILNIALQSGIALMAFAVPILIMGENPDTSAMDIAYVFPILLLIVGLRTLAELSSNSHVRKMGDITAEAILSLIAGFLVQTTEGGLHDCLSATTAFLGGAAISRAAQYVKTLFQSQPRQQPDRMPKWLYLPPKRTSWLEKPDSYTHALVLNLAFTNQHFLCEQNLVHLEL